MTGGGKAGFVGGLGDDGGVWCDRSRGRVIHIADVGRVEVGIEGGDGGICLLFE